MCGDIPQFCKGNDLLLLQDLLVQPKPRSYQVTESAVYGTENLLQTPLISDSRTFLFPQAESDSD